MTLYIDPNGTVTGPSFAHPTTYQGFKSATVHATPYGYLIVKLSTRDGTRFFVVEVVSESNTGGDGRIVVGKLLTDFPLTSPRKGNR